MLLSSPFKRISAAQRDQKPLKALTSQRRHRGCTIGRAGLTSNGYLDIFAVMAKVLVTLDDKLLARIDRKARSHGLTRSAFLARLAARDVDARQGPGRQARVRQALVHLDKLFSAADVREDATAAIRSERDAR